MKDFINRNSPIFVIGGFTLVIFIIVSLISQFKKQKSPEMIPLSENQIKYVESSSPKEINIPTEYEVDKNFGAKEITFTRDGFEPKDTQVVLNQKVVWVNKTEAPIKLAQIIPSYTEFREAITIIPGGTFEFRPYKPKIWSYKETGSEFKGSIFVIENK